MKRIKTGVQGVFYVETNKKHNGKPVRRYLIRYRYKGKQYEEAVGRSSERASDGNKEPMNTKRAAGILAELQENQRTGKGPCTFKERRAENEAKKVEAERLEAARKKADVTFKRFFDETFLPDARTRWKPETTEKAESHVKVWIQPVVKSKPMRELNLTDVNRIKSKLSAAKRSPRTQQYVFRTFAMIWNMAEDHGLVSGRCPTKKSSFRLPKVDNEKQRYLTHEEERKLLKTVRKRSQQAHDMAVVAINAGLRFKEIAELEWGDVDFDLEIIRVLDSKGKDRNVPMTEQLKSLFKSMEQGSPTDLIFPTGAGKIQKQVPSSFKRGVADAGLNDGIDNSKMKASCPAHRAILVRNFVQSGVDLYRVQRLLGHSTPLMTARYSKLADTDLREAVKAMEAKNQIQPEPEKAEVIQLRRVK